MKLILDDEECDEVVKQLDAAFRELRIEIRHTHESDAKEELRHREALLYRVLAQLGAEPSVPA